MLKVSLIGWSFDNRGYESNNWNTYFNDLPFDGDERFIDVQQLYHIHDNIIFMYINGSSV